MVNTLFLKAGLGGAVATTAGTVGIVYKDKIKDFFSNLSSKNSTYLIIKTSAESDNDIDNPLYDAENNTKNFDCIIKSKADKKDDSCEIFEIKEPSDNKLKNLKDINDSTTKATKEKIKTNTFFKLTISDSVLGSEWDGSQTIDIVSKTENKTGGAEKKKYGTFTLQYKVTGDVVEGKTNLIIGKITAKNLSTDLSESVNFNCTLGDEKEKKSCSLFKISQAPNNIKDVVLSGVTAATQTATDYDKDNWFVIDLKRTNPKHKISELKSKNIVVINQGTNSTPVATLEFQAALSETESSFSANNLSKIIFA